MKLPNAAQRLLHRFFMIQVVTEFFSTRLHHIDRWILAITGGRQTITGWMGWTIIQLHTTGARSGRARQTILIGVVDGDRIVVIASNFGRSHHPAWHHNLEANPACLVTVQGKTGNYVAAIAEGEQREKYWNMAVNLYRGYSLYSQRAAPRRIPVIVLCPVL
jgi:deazaflavin-dependent oxidoreductase (nitroreductase family)